MHLENQVGAGRDLSRRPLRDDRWLLSRGVANQQALRLVRLLSENDDVVDDSADARANLSRLNPFVFFEVGRHFEILVLDYAARGNRIFLWKIKHHVGLADVPAFVELRSGRKVFSNAFLCPLIDPRCYSVDVLFGKPAIVGEVAIVRVCVPRRHHTRRYLLFYRTRPRPRVLVRHQRHRRYFTGAVTLNAVVKEDWRHVPVKSNVALLRIARAASQSDDAECNNQKSGDRGCKRLFHGLSYASNKIQCPGKKSLGKLVFKIQHEWETCQQNLWARRSVGAPTGHFIFFPALLMRPCSLA